MLGGVIIRDDLGTLGRRAFEPIRVKKIGPDALLLAGLSVQGIGDDARKSQEVVLVVRRDKVPAFAPTFACQHPGTTVGDADDFGRVAAFLCSESARFITGAAIPIDGGANAALQ